MKKRFRFGAVLLALLLCAPLAAPAFAASGGTPEITWLSTSGQPYYYNEEFGWLSFGDMSRTHPFDLATGGQVAEYEQVLPFSDGLARAVKGNEAEGYQFVYLDKTGAEVFSLDNECANFSDGLALVGTIDGRYWKYGYIDTTGKVAIPLEYSSARDFSDGLALVARDRENYGYIDKNGAVVVPFGEYDETEDFSEGLARVTKYGEDGSKKCGFIDTTGAVAIPLEYDIAFSFSEGLAVVGKRDADGYEWTWSFIDKTGTTVITLPQGYFVYSYDLGAIVGIDGFSDGLALVGIENVGCGYIDTTGAVVFTLPREYKRVGNFSDGLALVEKDGKLGFIDKTGTVVVPLEYDRAGFVTGGENDTVRLCWVLKDGNYGIFENPNYVAPEVPSDPEPGNTDPEPEDTEPVSTEPGNSEGPGGESPAPSNPGSQNTQKPTAPGDATDNGGGFPVVPVAAATVGGVAVGAGAVVLALKKKK